MKEPIVKVSATNEEVIGETAELFTRIVSEALRNRERASVALSGGKTPQALFTLLSDPSGAYFQRVQWDRIDFFWGDERFVPSNDENSNFLMAKKSLLDRISVESSRIHRVVTENISPEESAQAYQRELQTFFLQNDLSKPPAFDLILLGMGTDGHTASLFPDAPLSELESGPFSDCWVKSFFVPHLRETQPLRISFTPKLINAARNIVFLVTGADKAQAFDRVFHSQESPLAVPAKLIKPSHGDLYWMIDGQVRSLEKKAS